MGHPAENRLFEFLPGFFYKIVTLFVFFLVAFSASLHVLWNTLVNTCDDKLAFALLTSVISFLVLIPGYIYLRQGRDNPMEAGVWECAALSGLFEATYTILLYNAYSQEDLSVVYPLSRGIAPVFTLIFGGLIVGDSVSMWHGISQAVVWPEGACAPLLIRLSGQ